TPGLFWDGPRSFEPRSDDEADLITSFLSLAPTSLQPSAPHKWGRFIHVIFGVNRPHKHGGPSVESGFELGALRIRRSDQ
ncbi:hypothetical protein AVEN_17298-1, partial [Araneus ventricosus]